MGNAPWSDISQLTDSVFTASYKFLILDMNSVNGTYKIFGNPAFQVGWGSTELSDVQGNFNPPLSLDVPILQQEVVKVVVVGNDKLGQWPTRYDIQLLNNGSVVATYNNIQQNSIEQVTNIDPIVTADTIRYTFYSNNIPSTTLKMIQASPDYRRYGNDSGLITLADMGEVLAAIKIEDTVTLAVVEVGSVGASIPIIDLSTLSFAETNFINASLSDSDIWNINTSSQEKFIMPVNDAINLLLNEVDVSSNIHSVLKSPARTVLCKVRIKYTLDNLEEGATVTSSIPNSYNTNIDNLINGYRNSFVKYAFASMSYSDDTYHPISVDGPDVPVTFYTLSDADGVLSTPLDITVTYPSATSLSTLVLAGDTWLNNFPVDFTINLYDTIGGPSIGTEVIVGNTDTEWTMSVSYPNVIQVIYNITKINRPNLYPAIQEVVGAVVEEYYNDDIMSVSILEEVVPVTSDVSLGQISANQLELELINTDGFFSSTNINSPIYNLLNLNREIKVWFGAKVSDIIEWYPMGTFYSGPWETTWREVNAKTLANDGLTIMNNNICTVETMRNISYGQYFIEILVNGGIPITQISIDDDLFNMYMPFAFVPYGSTIDALSYIAQSVLCYIHSDRLGRMEIVRRSALKPFQTAYTPNDIYDYVNLIDDRIIINYAKVSFDGFNIITTDINDNSMSDVTLYDILPGETRVLNFVFGVVPYTYSSIRSIVQGSNVVIEEIILTSWGIQITVKNNSSQTQQFGDIVLNGEYLSPQENQQLVTSVDASITQVGRYEWDYTHPLLQTIAQATQLSQDITNYYATQKPFLELDTRGDFAIDMGYDVLAQTYNDYTTYSRYKQIRAQHQWAGSYRVVATLEYEEPFTGAQAPFTIL